MRSHVAILLAIVLPAIGCSLHGSARRCNFSDFNTAHYDHLIEELPATTTAELTGRFKVRPQDIGGGWPAGLDAMMELHGPGGFTEFVRPAADGTFVRRGLTPGTYCFKVSASGFRSMVGTVVIDPAVRQETPWDIELMLSE
jgi:hypothetical protein